MQGGVFLFPLGFKSFRELVLWNVYSCEISFPPATVLTHSSGVIAMVLNLDAGGYFLYFAILVVFFPRDRHRTFRAQSSLGGFDDWEDTQSWFCIIYSKAGVEQMQCTTDLSISVALEPGVPGGFSTSLGVGQGGVCF